MNFSSRIRITEAIKENGISAIVSEDIADMADEKIQQENIVDKFTPVGEAETLGDIETIADEKEEELLGDDVSEKEPILMAKIENVYHEPFQMSQEVKVRKSYLYLT